MVCIAKITTLANKTGEGYDMHDKTTDLLAKYRKDHAGKTVYYGVLTSEQLLEIQEAIKDMTPYESVHASIDDMPHSTNVFKRSLLEPDTRIVYWFSE